MELFLISNQSVIYTCLFFGMMSVIALWELFAPRRENVIPLRKRWAGNFGVLFANTIVTCIVYPGFGIGSAVLAAQMDWGLLRILDAPYWLAFLISIVVMDIGHYAVHFAFHRVPLLWRIHRLHHTDTDFDFTTGIRFHPLEAILEHGAKLSIIILLGPPVYTVVLFEFAYIVTTSWVHGNIKMVGNSDRRLRNILVTPDMHRIHHSNRVEETESNYGGLFSWWDRLFGTYVDEPAAGQLDMIIGLDEFRANRHLKLGWMLANPALKVERQFDKTTSSDIARERIE